MFRLSEAPRSRRYEHPPYPALTPAGLADVAGEASNRFTDLCPVIGIDPVDGWTMMSDNTFDVTYGAVEFYARGPSGDVHLDVSRWRLAFSPSQARFAWLVRNGFPHRRGVTPWTNGALDVEVIADLIGRAA